MSGHTQACVHRARTLKIGKIRDPDELVLERLYKLPNLKLCCGEGELPLSLV